MAEQDEVDLSEVERIKIDRTFDRLQRLTYYEILDVSQQATKAQIKRNYYLNSKEYHPDRYFRRTLGPYKEKLESIFDLVTKAYNTLNDDALRAAYDRSLIDGTLQFPGASHEVAFSSEPARSPEPPNPPPRAESAPPQAEPSVAPTATPHESREAAGESSGPARPLFMGRLQQQITQRIQKGREYLKLGKEAFERGQFGQAIGHLQLALSYDANSTEARLLLEQASARVADVRAETYYQRAVQELTVGNTDRAKEFLKLAVDCKPRRGHYYFKLGTLLLDGNSDIREVVEQFKLAVQFDPRNVEYLLALARAYEELKMPRNALREYDKVLAVDKSNQVALKSAKRLKALI